MPKPQTNQPQTQHSKKKNPKLHLSLELIPAFFTFTLNRNTFNTRFLNYNWGGFVLVWVFFSPLYRHQLNWGIPSRTEKKKITYEASQTAKQGTQRSFTTFSLRFSSPDWRNPWAAWSDPKTNPAWAADFTGKSLRSLPSHWYYSIIQN